MKFLHTADWHLGRLFNRVHLTDDQAHLLDQLVTLAVTERVDAVLIAGDVYDRAVPPPEAVKLLDRTLTRLAVEHGIAVLLLAGNHDSGDRLGFGRELLAARGLHVAGSLQRTPVRVELQDQHGPVHIYMLPYAEPALVRERLGRDDLRTHQEAMAALIEQIHAQQVPHARNLLMAHAFVIGGEPCDSERALSVGGSGAIEHQLFAGFDYVALGHLHRPQQVGQPHIRYSGSLMKYSFSEATHRKSVTLVELDADGQLQVEQRALTPRREVRVIEGYFKELLAQGAHDPHNHDYLKIKLLDTEMLLDPIGRLREVYPNLLELERPMVGAAGSLVSRSREQRSQSPAQLFAAFYEQMCDTPLSEPQQAALQRVLSQLARQEREA